MEHEYIPKCEPVVRYGRLIGYYGECVACGQYVDDRGNRIIDNDGCHYRCRSTKIRERYIYKMKRMCLRIPENVTMEEMVQFDVATDVSENLSVELVGWYLHRNHRDVNGLISQLVIVNCQRPEMIKLIVAIDTPSQTIQRYYPETIETLKICIAAGLGSRIARIEVETSRRLESIEVTLAFGWWVFYRNSNRGYYFELDEMENIVNILGCYGYSLKKRIGMMESLYDFEVYYAEEFPEKADDLAAYKLRIENMKNNDSIPDLYDLIIAKERRTKILKEVDDLKCEIDAIRNHLHK